jgi:hypothetical protein
MADDKAWKRYQRRLRKAKGDPDKAKRAGQEYLIAKDKTSSGKGCVITALVLVASATATWKGWT